MPCGKITDLMGPIHLRPMINVEDVDGAGSLIDPIDDAVGTASGSVASGERAEQSLAHPVRIGGQRLIAELQGRSSNRFGQTLRDSSASRRKESHREASVLAHRVV